MNGPILKNDSAFSPTFGVVIILCILFLTSVIAGSVFYVHYSDPEMPPMINLDVSEGTQKSLRLSHQGGDTLNFGENLKLLIVTNGETYEINTSSLDNLSSGEEIEFDLVDKYGCPIENLSAGDIITLKIVNSGKVILLEDEVTLTRSGHSNVQYGTEQEESSDNNDSSDNESAAVDLTNISGTVVRLIDSNGNPLAGGVVKYYHGGWKEFGITDDNGLAINSLDNGTYTFRMSYNYASYDICQNITADNIVDFQTTLVTVRLLDSTGELISTDSSTVKYYSGGWRDFGTTTDGVVQKELLPRSYTFRMNYEYASLDKTQDISSDAAVDFQTTLVTVKLLDSSGDLISTDSSTVKYYSGGWRDFGTTTDGIVQKELLPRSYTFRMNYEYASLDKTQDISSDAAVDFQTTLVTVRLLDSTGELISTDSSTVKYYSGGWRDFGTTTDGIVQKELLPRSYTFRMNYEYASLDKTQDVSSNAAVDFQTSLVTVKLLDSMGELIDTDSSSVKYYSGGWRNFGTTTDGVAQKELLPKSYTFRMSYEYASLDESQDVSSDAVVDFRTSLVTVRLLDNTGAIIDTDSGLVKYYSGGWRTLGYTNDGSVGKELLPKSYTFRLTYNYGSDDMVQDTGSDAVVDIRAGKVICDSGSCTHYYSGGWRTFSNGMQLMAGDYTFRFNDVTPDTVISVTAGHTTDLDDYI